MSAEMPVIDERILEELRASVGGDDEFVADLARTFLVEGQDHVDAMTAAAAHADTAAIVRPAHSLKSSSAALGASRLSHICREIEFAGREGQTADLAAAVDRARSTWEQTIADLRERGILR